jgi:citrate synthase
MSETAALTFGGKSFEYPVITGSEREKAIDISRLRQETGLITLDDGYGNTGSCQSAITFIDGEQGILRYRGYPIEELAEYSTFPEVAYLLIFGELPTPEELMEFRALLTEHQFIHEAMRHHFDGFPADAPPMAILSAMINTAGCFLRELIDPDHTKSFMDQAARLLAKTRTIAAASYRVTTGLPINYPRFDLSYTGNLLHLMFCMPNMPYEPSPELVRALDQIFILHADHEQNCSTSTVRMVASSQAGLYASVAAGVCALWGPLHGGANQAVIEMLEQIRASGESVVSFVKKVKDDPKNTRLMGFGHRVYKNFDPRAKIIKSACHTVLSKLGLKDPLLDIAVQLEEVALKDQYFIERKLYPNVDFYSGIIMRAARIPIEMFPVMFAIGRMPGWIANWREVNLNSKSRIYRPRQIYTGPTERPYVKLADRAPAR